MPSLSTSSTTLSAIPSPSRSASASSASPSPSKSRPTASRRPSPSRSRSGPRSQIVAVPSPPPKQDSTSSPTPPGHYWFPREFHQVISSAVASSRVSGPRSNRNSLR